MKKTKITNNQVMTNKAIVALIKAVIDPTTVKPILESVYLQRDRFTLYNLNTFVTIPYQSGIEACIPYKNFISVLEIMNQPTFHTEDNLAVFIKENSREIKIKGDDPNYYPTLPVNKDIDFKEIGQWTEIEIEYLKTALPFVGKDDLRPAMTGIFASKHIAATDAHRLYWKALESPLTQEVIIPVEAAKILINFGNKNWKLFYGIEYKPVKEEANKKTQEPEIEAYHILFKSDDGFTVGCKAINARFPDFQVVIPKDESLLDMAAPTLDLREELKYAMKFGNKSTNMIILDLNGSAKISSRNIDTGTDYGNTLESVTYQFKETGKHEFTIAFDGQKLDSILEQIEGEASFKFWKSTQAAVINDEYLIMPLMLNQ